MVAGFFHRQKPERFATNGQAAAKLFYCQHQITKLRTFGAAGDRDFEARSAGLHRQALELTVALNMTPNASITPERELEVQHILAEVAKLKRERGDAT